jgi:hypothetical protein
MSSGCVTKILMQYLCGVKKAPTNALCLLCYQSADQTYHVLVSVSFVRAPSLQQLLDSSPTLLFESQKREQDVCYSEYYIAKPHV